MTTHHRSNNFDAMRIVAAVAVIYGHAHPLAGVPDVGVLGNSVQALAIKVFFVISGCLVAKSWALDPNPLHYLAKRSLRIFPGLALMLLLTVLFLGPALTGQPLGDYFRSPGTWRYLTHNLALYPIYGLSDLFSTNVYPGAVNGSLWSLPAEFFMYLLFPLVYVCSRMDKTNRLLVAFTIVLCALSLYGLRGSRPFQPVVIYGTGLPSVLDVSPYFFLGSLFAVTRLARALDPTMALFLVALSALLQPVGAQTMELLLYIMLPYCVLSFVTNSSPIISKVGRFGDPSYGIYLYGFVVQQTVFYLWGRGMTPLHNTLVSVPIAVLLAYGSWHLVEKRALSLKPRRARQEGRTAMKGVDVE